jgi:putative hemolysin
MILPAVITIDAVGVLWRCLLLLALLLFNAMLAMSEIALTRVSRIKARSLLEEDRKGSEDLLKLVEHHDRFLPTILGLTLLVSLGASAVATDLAVRLGLPGAAAIATGAMTLVFFIFGEMAPKSYAVNNYEKVALKAAPVIDAISSLLYPVIRVLMAVSNGVIRLFGGKVYKEGPFVSEGDIKTMVTVAEEQDVIEAEEKKLLHSIFEFGDTLVREVMVPRTDMVALPDTANLETALDTIVQTGYSRIPVYRKGIDDVVGVLYAKDLLAYLKRGESDVVPQEIMREPIFVPESKRVIELLSDLRNRKTHLAVVLDEYGGTAGLVTIEDLLEEIVGEIFDEYDREEVMFESISDGKYLFDARIPMGDINELLKTDLPAHEWDTLGGLMYNLLGRVPKPGESVVLTNIRLTAEKVVGRRISKVKLEVLKQDGEKEGR